jgi:metallo-beta-lactamase superfamily protein
MKSHRVTSDVTLLSDCAELPGLGFLTVNTFVIHASQPVVIDTGLGTPDKDFVADLATVIDPADVRWIWLTHPDRDHTGGLFNLLDVAPHARVITTYLGVGALGCERPLPMDRIYLLNPGQSLDVGDRTLTGLRPPLFDNPATVGVIDGKSGAFFSSDCFGGPMPSADVATSPDVREAPADELRGAQLLWAGVDSPWIHQVDRERFRTSVEPVRQLDASAIFSTHLPPAFGLNDTLIEMLYAAPESPPFVGPDQRALQEMLAAFEPPGTPAMAT